MTTLEPQKLSRRVLFGGLAGNFIEWYDYTAYAYLAVIISTKFFPLQNPTASLLATLATFALSFAMRPIGGILFGFIGDRVGRRGVLAVIIGLVSLGTFLLGVIPSYATIGIAAPIIVVVLRLVQGISAGGEYAGAASFLTESVPANKRGQIASWLPISTTISGLFTLGLVTVLNVTLPAQAMDSWGWRIPFLLALPFGLIGLYIRLGLEETAAFRVAQHSGELVANPLGKSVTRSGRALLLLFGIVIFQGVGYYGLQTYMNTYLTTVAKESATMASLITTVQLVAFVIAGIIIGRLSDRYGRKRFMMASCIGAFAVAYPGFVILSSSNTGIALLIIVQVVFGVVLALNVPFVAAFTELFPTGVRYSGFALPYNIASALFGGTAPFLAAALVAATSHAPAPAWLVMAAAAISAISLTQMKDRTGEALEDIKYDKSRGVEASREGIGAGA